MKQKYTDILSRYGDEVDEMRGLFERFREDPPLTKGKPPTSGRIAWSESIFMRVKRPIMKFKTRDGLLDSDDGKKICKKYYDLGRDIKHAYQKDL